MKLYERKWDGVKGAINNLSNYRRSIILKTVNIIILAVSFLQSRPINGKVTGQNNVVLRNVNIISLPSGVGTQSDDFGSFLLMTQPRDKYVIVSHIGYVSDTIDITYFNNNALILLKEKNIIMDSLDVEANSWGQSNYFSENKMVNHIDLENSMIRGSIDIGDALFSEYPVSMDETIGGKKNLSLRGSSNDELIFLYDGIRINNLSSGMLDISQFTSLGLSKIELISGNNENTIHSSGAINLVPKINYDNQFTLNQKFGTYDFGSFDAYGSLGMRFISVNTGFSNGKFLQRYSDSDNAELQNEYKRNLINMGFRNGKGHEIKLMGFRNEKKFNNDRTKDTLDLYTQNLIVKYNDKNNFIGNISIYGFSQEQKVGEFTSFQRNKNNDELEGIGIWYEKKVRNSILRFSTERNRIRSAWTIDNDQIQLSRKGIKSIGVFEMLQPTNNEGLHLNDLKFVFSKERVNSENDLGSAIFLEDKDWESINTKFTVSMIDRRLKIKRLVFINLSNAFRIPSIYERVHSKINALITNNDLVPEQKSMAELGVKLEDHDSMNNRSMNAGFTAFRYKYTDKIKQLYFEDAIIQVPINYGSASIFGFDNSINLNLVEGRVILGTYLTNYFFSDAMAFQLQPNKMFRTTIQVKNSLGMIKFIYRKESERYLTTIGENGIQNQTKIKPLESLDIDISRKVSFDFADIAISFSGKNLNNPSHELMGLSIYDKRFILSFHLSIQ